METEMSSFDKAVSDLQNIKKKHDLDTLVYFDMLDLLTSLSSGSYNEGMDRAKQIWK